MQRLTATLSSVLAKDPDFLPALEKLQGKCLAIHVLGIGATFYLQINLDSFELTSVLSEQDPDVTINGAPIALLMLLLSPDAMQSAQNSGVKIQGDLHVAKQLSETINSLDIDWEGILAQYIGDVPAHQIGVGLQGIFGWHNRTRESLLMAMSEYLQEESRALPTRVEIERFLDRVDQLRDAAERLEARLARLSK